MSWSIAFIGSPENITKALRSHSDTLAGVSKEEYDAALPHIEAIVNQNFNKAYPTLLDVKANGHGYEGSYGYCNVSVGPLIGTLV